MNDRKTKTWLTNRIKGTVAEVIAEQLFISLGFKVFKFGMEHSVPHSMEEIQQMDGKVAKNIRQMPDFIALKNGKAFLIEVKYRSSGKFSINDIKNSDVYPYKEAYFLLLSKRHIKCLSFRDLKKGKSFTESCRNYLGSVKEFEIDKEIVIPYCKEALKFFQNID
ncbi:hypothetical protein [Allomuricauda sp. d1]|uniref:hypothetical protein n=1 Tax=Allomuricauda sp. d1 TaxID=3136725 RepID=UPI0031CEC2FC